MRVFLSHSHDAKASAESLINALRTSDYEFGNDSLFAPGESWTDTIIRAVRSSDVVIGLLDPGSSNANVLFELGLAVGAGKTVILLAQPDAVIPVDLQTFPCVSAGSHDQPSRVLVSMLDQLHRHGTSAKDYPEARGAESLIAFLRRCTVSEREHAIDSMDARQFERLMLMWFTELGWDAEDLTAERRDPGFDFLLRKRSFVVAVEVKRFPVQSRISIESVRRLAAGASAWGAEDAWLVSTCPFTSSAMEFAKQSPPRVSLFTLAELIDEKNATRFFPPV